MALSVFWLLIFNPNQSFRAGQQIEKDNIQNKTIREDFQQAPLNRPVHRLRQGQRRSQLKRRNDQSKPRPF